MPPSLLWLLFGIAAAAVPASADGHKMTFTLATAGSETDQRSVAMAEVFAPMVAEFADYQPGYNGTLFAQGTELEAISRGNLTMSIASAQELAQFFPRILDLRDRICPSGRRASGTRLQ